MTRSSSFFIGGAVASLGLHLLFFGLLTPCLTPERYAFSRWDAVFLGAILARVDLKTVGVSLQEGGTALGAVLLAPGKAASYHAKEPQAPLKPLPALAEMSVMGAPQESPVPAHGAGAPRSPARVHFYLFDPPAFLRNVDFSDLKKMVEREDVAAHMECALTLTPDGRVRAVRRITGSGHPILDSFIIFKLQRAVFQTDDLNVEQPVRLFIRLK